MCVCDVCVEGEKCVKVKLCLLPYVCLTLSLSEFAGRLIIMFVSVNPYGVYFVASAGQGLVFTHGIGV